LLIFIAKCQVDSFFHADQCEIKTNLFIIITKDLLKSCGVKKQLEPGSSDIAIGILPFHASIIGLAEATIPYLI